MPKLKDASKPRQRCARACDQCRQRKEKCDSQQPCAGCIKRNLECYFSPASKPNASPGAQSEVPSAKRVKTTEPPKQPEANDLHVTNEDENEFVESSNREEDVSKQRTGTIDGQLTEAPVPKVARILRDGQGIFIYIGDSASLSFVQNVRRVVVLKLGECDFTTDELRHSFLEHIPSDGNGPDSISASQLDVEDGDLRPFLDEAEMLLDQYFAATGCLLDLFSNPYLIASLRTWTSGRLDTNNLSIPILQLVLAIGAQAKAENGYDIKAERYFSQSQHTSAMSPIQTPTLQTIQYYTLTAMYLLGACRRNASYMSLGVALRAAYALGLHRADLHPVFSESDRHSRHRIWQSLRMIDLFLSASLGRPPSTSEFVGLLPSEDTCLKSDSSLGERFAPALAGLCAIFEKILDEVYKKRVVTIHTADDISQRYRAWAAQLPTSNGESSDELEPLSQTSEMIRVLSWAHMTSNYHWSIILLTRPFLMFRISTSNRNPSFFKELHKSARSGAASISTLAESCVDSALKILDIADDLITYPSLPKRLPFILNAIFNAALAIGAAFFGDLDRSFPLHEGISKAERVLETLRNYDPQARRHAQIVTLLRRASEDYLRARERLSMQQSNKRKRDIFGVFELPILKPFSTPNNARTEHTQPGQNTTIASASSRLPYCAAREPTPLPRFDAQEPGPSSYGMGQQQSMQYDDPISITASADMPNRSSGMDQPQSTMPNQSLETAEAQDPFEVAAEYDLASYNDILPMFNVFGELVNQGSQFADGELAGQLPDDWNFVVPINLF